ncbi:MAG: exo-beta-N-acetylmuramidase NamZ domain-containing protein [Candidatus Baltobacteraceae bacterium]
MFSAIVFSVLAALLPPAHVTLGDEVFLQSAWHDLHGRCVGVVTNQTGVTSRLESIVDAMRANPKICLRAIYSPEHGLRGDRPAGAYVSSYTDARTGLPVFSLYGPQRHPTAQMLSGVDVLLFDIQDVGARPYTYISTMAYAMQAAKQFGKEIWVLDRPNPIGGTMVEGPVLDARYKSFIGLYPIAMRHGMTAGELARLFNVQFGIGARLRVIAMKGWHRSMLWPDTGLQWVQASPNMPEWTTAVVYPCSGLIDNAGLNAGIGTTKPFKYAGASGLDAVSYARALNARGIPGVYFRAAYWSPILGAQSTPPEYGGVELDVFDPHVFPAVRTAVELLTAARDLAPGDIAVRDKQLATDWGTGTLAAGLESGLSAQAIVARWQPGLARFMQTRKKFLLYR